MLDINKIKKRMTRVVPFSNNHFIIRTELGALFQSYESIVAFKPSSGDTATIGRHWNYSSATVRNLGKWLGMSGKEIKQAIKDGSLIYDEELI